MKYEYDITYPPDADGRFRKRPLLEIEIVGPQGKLKELALVDSGADRSLFHREIAEYLGIDVTHAERRRTIGVAGEAEVLYTEVAITLAGAPKPIRILVGFIDTPYVSALLGQEGFLMRTASPSHGATGGCQENCVTFFHIGTRSPNRITH